MEYDFWQAEKNNDYRWVLAGEFPHIRILQRHIRLIAENPPRQGDFARLPRPGHADYGEARGQLAQGVLGLARNHVLIVTETYNQPLGHAPLTGAPSESSRSLSIPRALPIRPAPRGGRCGAGTAGVCR